MLALEKPRGYSQKLAVSVVYFQEKYGKIELRMASKRLHKHPTHATEIFNIRQQTHRGWVKCALEDSERSAMAQ